uniref:CCK-1 n=1 Tax=Charonia tritonis TaxID=1960912 RepID=A0A1S6JQ05_9CAEN|nr:CCK-1 precursor [Charonia tritonis]
MEHSQHLFITIVAVLLCGCVTIALPTAHSDSVQDLSHLVNLIGKLKHLDTHINDDNWALISNDDDDDTSQTGISTGPASPSAADKVEALRKGFLGFNKRQGFWSYDYGLGGGRFGKRYYGDYGIGGGRFGRDVDHVDVADSNDSTL